MFVGDWVEGAGGALVSSQGKWRVRIAGVDRLILPVVEIEVLAWALTEADVDVNDMTEVLVGVRVAEGRARPVASSRNS